MTVKIDVGDGTLISPPPAQPYVPPAPQPPPVPPAPAPPPVAVAIDPRPIIQPGKAYIVDVDIVGNPIIIPAPPATPAPAPVPPPPPPAETVDPPVDDPPWTHWYQGDPLDTFSVDDLDSEFLAVILPLRGKDFVDYVREGCASRNLDAYAVFAQAYNEGISGKVGDNGDSFGPWQLYRNGRLPRMYRSYPKSSPKVNTWAWSRQGIDYALDGMVGVGAAGLRGVAAVTVLTEKYEVPADWQARNIERIRTYEQLSRLGGGAWPFLAGLAKGPVTVATTAAPAAPPKPPTVKVLGAWRELVAVLRDDVPASGVKMKNTAKRLTKAVA